MSYSSQITNLLSDLSSLKDTLLGRVTDMIGIELTLAQLAEIKLFIDAIFDILAMIDDI